MLIERDTVTLATHQNPLTLLDRRSPQVMAVELEHGTPTMVVTAKTEPVSFFALCSKLIPRDVAITVGQGCLQIWPTLNDDPFVANQSLAARKGS
jgi:hypothetical protein